MHDSSLYYPFHQIPIPWPSILFFQMTRNRKILALVPKCGAKSDMESRESSEDDFQICRPHQDISEDSSSVRSVASSVENVNIFDCDECEYREIYTIASVHEEPRYRHKTIDSTPNSPSILQHDPDIILLSLSNYIPPSPSIDSICSTTPSTPDAPIQYLRQLHQLLCIFGVIRKLR